MDDIFLTFIHIYSGTFFYTKNMIDEGYIKYNIHWDRAEALPTFLLTDIEIWRKKMYDAGLIGFDSTLKVGYGNISIRHPENPAQFIISGTQTGHLAALTPEHYTVVTAYDIPGNSLHCEGPIKASSESLTHAAVYELNPDFQAVIHIHSLAMWTELLHQIPTTSEEVPYGTPEMAFEVARLYRETSLSEGKLFAMAGHQDGLVAFGVSLEEAGVILLKRVTSHDHKNK